MTTMFVDASLKELYKNHREKWRDCTRCPLCKTRNKVVLYRGTMPAEVLFIGEAPGESENQLALPFVGPSGRLLNDIIFDASQKVGREFDYGVTNVVGCWPTEPRETSSPVTRIPTKEELLACRPRLMEIVAMANPKLIVTLGDLARKTIPRQDPLFSNVPNIALIHPAAILRQDTASGKELHIKRSVLTLAEAIRKLE